MWDCKLQKMKGDATKLFVLFVSNHTCIDFIYEIIVNKLILNIIYFV